MGTVPTVLPTAPGTGRDSGDGSSVLPPAPSHGAVGKTVGTVPTVSPSTAGRVSEPPAPPRHTDVRRSRSSRVRSRTPAVVHQPPRLALAKARPPRESKGLKTCFRPKPLPRQARGGLPPTTDSPSPVTSPGKTTDQGHLTRQDNRPGSPHRHRCPAPAGRAGGPGPLAPAGAGLGPAQNDESDEACGTQAHVALGLVRHQGLEPRTRWLRASCSAN